MRCDIIPLYYHYTHTRKARCSCQSHLVRYKWLLICLVSQAIACFVFRLTADISLYKFIDIWSLVLYDPTIATPLSSWLLAGAVFRLIYVAQINAAVYLSHASQEETQQFRGQDVANAGQRLIKDQE